MYGLTGVTPGFEFFRLPIVNHAHDLNRQSGHRLRIIIAHPFGNHGELQVMRDFVVGWSTMLELTRSCPTEGPWTIAALLDGSPIVTSETIVFSSVTVPHLTRNPFLAATSYFIAVPARSPQTVCYGVQRAVTARCRRRFHSTVEEFDSKTYLAEAQIGGRSLAVSDPVATTCMC